MIHAERQTLNAKRLDEGGMTLIEIVVGMALLSLAMVVATMSYISISRLQQKGVTVRGVQQNSRYLLEAIVRDVRNATEVSYINQFSTGGCSSDSLPDNLHLITNVSGTASTVKYTYRPTEKEVWRNNSSISSRGVRVTTICYEIVELDDAKPFVRVKMTVEAPTPGLGIRDPYYQVYNLATVVAPEGL